MTCCTHEMSVNMKRLSVVIPAYNEAERISETVQTLRKTLTDDLGVEHVEIVVVDDGSDDNTSTLAEAAGADTVLQFTENTGKGAAVRAGVQASSGQVVAFTDADLAYPPHQIKKMLEIAEKSTDVVVGNRRHLDTNMLTQPTLQRSIGSRIVYWTVKILGIAACEDTQCGLKVFRRKAADTLFSASTINGFAFDVELLYLTKRYGLTLQEVPVEVHNSTSSSVRMVRDGLILIKDTLSIRIRAMRGTYTTNEAIIQQT